jgi:hypothetical protein
MDGAPDPANQRPSAVATLDRRGERELRALTVFHWANRLAFLSVFVLVFGAFLAPPHWVEYMWPAGFGIAFVLLAESMVLYPFLRCPACRGRFFVASGRFGPFLGQVDMGQNACYHCGTPLGGSRKDPPQNTPPAA